MALTDAARTALVATVAARIVGTILGREASAGAVETGIAEGAVTYVCDYAPAAPESLLREAAIRFAGWMYGSRPHVTEQEMSEPSGTSMRLKFHQAATANGFRASGASALLSRYVQRRAGAVVDPDA